MLRQQKMVTFFSIPERFLTLCHTLQSCTCSTQNCYNQFQSLVYACVQFQHSCLHSSNGKGWKKTHKEIFPLFKD
jgi:hypothetical protein